MGIYDEQNAQPDKKHLQKSQGIKTTHSLSDMLFFNLSSRKTNHNKYCHFY